MLLNIFNQYKHLLYSLYQYYIIMNLSLSESHDLLTDMINDTVEQQINQPTVIQNSDTLYRKPFDVVENIEVKEITQFEKDMLKGTLNPQELLEKEKHEEQKQYTQEELDKLKQREYITKVKVIAIDRLGKFPLSNPSFFRRREKEELKILMEHIIKDMNEEEIQREFNEICCEKIFAPGVDVSQFPIYN